MAHEGSRRAIVAAASANLGIAVAKIVAFAITGATSLLAEAIHSVADTGNQGLLLLGGRRSRQAPDERHPFGHGRERYFAAFVVALVLFSVGGLFAVYEGIQKVLHPHELGSPVVAFVVLGVAIVLESLSLRTAVQETAHVRRPGQSYPTFIRSTTVPELPVVLLEDAGALVGLALALLGTALAEVTRQPRFDAVGSIAIGEAAEPEVVAAAQAALAGAPGVASVIHLRTLQLGPDDLLVAAKLELAGAPSYVETARTIDAVEVVLRAAVPSARLVFLEPDVRRP